MVGGAPSDINTLRASSLSSNLAASMPAQAEKSLALSLRNIYETLAISWPTVVDSTLGRVTKETCDRRLDRWCKKVVAHAAMDVEVIGREHMAPGETYLIMSNHQSLYDVPVIFYVVGPNVRMIAKVELFRVPIFGPAIREAGFIAIDRGNRKKAIGSLNAARETLSGGVHVWIAPEGTRSRTGELLPFKKGGFTLALDTGLPVLPVALYGTRDALRADGLRSVRGAKVRVTICAPIDPKRYAGARLKPGREQFMADVRKAIESGL
jgi:1-acyl-sn-glycerol-3-phosphate acyltransferase